MIVPNTARDLVCHVIIIATGLDKTSGTIYAYIRRDSDGYYLWSGGSWSATLPTSTDIPTATYIAQGLWRYTLSSGATNALTPGMSVSCRMTDNATPASATVTSDVVEHLVDKLTGGAPALTAAAVWEESMAGHSTAGSAGQAQARIDVAVSTRSTLGGVAQTGDCFPRIGSPTTSSIAADIAGVNTTASNAVAAAELARKLVGNRAVLVANQYKVYEDDGSTVLKTYDTLDSSGTPSITNIAQKVPV
jgi:hypothetical protein